MAFQDYPNDDFIDVVDESNHKKKKDKSKKNIPFENALEGYILEPVDVTDLSKGHLNWSCVGKQPLSFSNAKLSEISRKVFVERHLGPMTVFNSLSADQRGVITRVIEDCQNREKDKNAVWVLECVRKYNKAVKKNWRHSLIVCHRLMVIVKRQEKHAGRDGRVPYKPNTFNANEIIDLKVPAKKKNKKKDKHRDDDWEHDDWEHLPLDNNNIFENFQQGPNQPDDFGHHGHENGPFPGVPEGAIPVPDNWQPQMPENPGVYPNNPMDAGWAPPRYEPRREPPIEARVFAPTPPLHRRDHHSRSRSRSRDRRRGEARRREEEHEIEMEDLRRREKEELLDRMQRMDMRDRSPSDDSHRVDEAYWSGASRGTITPPSSPSLSEIYPSDHHHRKQYRRDGGHPLRDRSKRYYREGSAYVEPYSSTDRRLRHRGDFERIPGGGFLRYPSLSSRGQRRAILHQDHYSDNPFGSGPLLLPQEPGDGYFPAEFTRMNDRRRRKSRERERDDEVMYRDDQRDFGRRARAWMN